MLGQTFGNYRLIRRIGAGGMGEVFLAEHTRIARRAAVKVLLPHVSAEPAHVERFFVEARATSFIQHKGIIEILDCDMQGDRAFIVMEYLEGDSLGGLLQRTGSLIDDLPTLYYVAAHTADALAAAHERGIVHRDLKPDNVFLATNADADGPFRVKF